MSLSYYLILVAVVLDCYCALPSSYIAYHILNHRKSTFLAFYLELGPFRTKRVYKLRTTGAIFDRSTAKGKGVGVSGFYEGDCDSRLYWEVRIVRESFEEQKWETTTNLIRTTCSLFCHFSTVLNDSPETSSPSIQERNYRVL